MLIDDSLKTNFDPEEAFSYADYDILYIGKLKDTLPVSHRIYFYLSMELPPGSDGLPQKRKPGDWEKYYVDWLSDKKYRHWHWAKIGIRIDTAVMIDQSYPVLLTNLQNDTIEIGYGNVLPLIMEARDSSGKWRPIEERFIYSCGNGIGTIILPPGEVVLSTAPILQGNYQTEFRLTIGKNRSRPFRGRIDYGKFR